MTFREEAALRAFQAGLAMGLDGLTVVERSIALADHLTREACDQWGHDFPVGVHPAHKVCQRCGHKVRT